LARHLEVSTFKKCKLLLQVWNEAHRIGSKFVLAIKHLKLKVTYLTLRDGAVEIGALPLILNNFAMDALGTLVLGKERSVPFCLA